MFSLTGKIDGGLPAFQPPPFSIAVNVSSEAEHGLEAIWEMKYFGFGDMVSTLGAAIIIIPVIAILESVAIAKAFGNKGYCQAQVQSQIQVPNPGPISKSQIQSPKERDWGLG